MDYRQLPGPEKGAVAPLGYLGQKPEQNFNVSRDFWSKTYCHCTVFHRLMQENLLQFSPFHSDFYWLEILSTEPANLPPNAASRRMS